MVFSKTKMVIHDITLNAALHYSPFSSKQLVHFLRSFFFPEERGLIQQKHFCIPLVIASQEHIHKTDGSQQPVQEVRAFSLIWIRLRPLRTPAIKM
jgi:hypothetical protein